LKLSSITAAVSIINEGNQSENIIDILKLTLLKYIDYIYHHFLEFHHFIISSFHQGSLHTDPASIDLSSNRPTNSGISIISLKTATTFNVAVLQINSPYE